MRVEQSYAGVTAKIEGIDARSAKLFLATNFKNRPVQRGIVADLASQMMKGQWLLNGEAIIFDQDGRMIDGQHRLHAIIKSGVTDYASITTNAWNNFRACKSVRQAKVAGDFRVDGFSADLFEERG